MSFMGNPGGGGGAITHMLSPRAMQ